MCSNENTEKTVQTSSNKRLRPHTHNSINTLYLSIPPRMLTLVISPSKMAQSSVSPNTGELHKWYIKNSWRKNIIQLAHKKTMGSKTYTWDMFSIFHSVDMVCPVSLGKFLFFCTRISSRRAKSRFVFDGLPGTEARGYVVQGKNK